MSDQGQGRKRSSVLSAPKRARGGCDAPGVPSRCQSRQKRLLSGERPSAPPGGDGWSDNRDRARDVGGRQL